MAVGAGHSRFLASLCRLIGLNDSFKSQAERINLMQHQLFQMKMFCEIRCNVFLTFCPFLTRVLLCRLPELPVGLFDPCGVLGPVHYQCGFVCLISLVSVVDLFSTQIMAVQAFGLTYIEIIKMMSCHQNCANSWEISSFIPRSTVECFLFSHVQLCTG